jgi:hypothetical protein
MSEVLTIKPNTYVSATGDVQNPEYAYDSDTSTRAQVYSTIDQRTTLTTSGTTVSSSVSYLFPRLSQLIPSNANILSIVCSPHINCRYRKPVVRNVCTVSVTYYARFYFEPSDGSDPSLYYTPTYGTGKSYSWELKGTAFENYLLAGSGRLRVHSYLRAVPKSSGTVITSGYVQIDFSGIELEIEYELPSGLQCKVKVNGNWEEAEVLVKVNGEWVNPSDAFVKVNGVWEPIE